MEYINIFLLIGIVFGINLPFGYWRADTTRLTGAWALAIHIPVPFIFLTRYLLGFSWTILPVSVAAFFLGQLIGGKIKPVIKRRIDTTSCLVVDVWRFSGLADRVTARS